MGKIFDFKELVHHNKVKKHKVKPAQFESVTDGIKKRLENNLNHRKSSRLSVFDRLRSIQQCESPTPAPVMTKEEHRRQQLEKWKAEKDKRKKEAAANKKKPFLTGVPRAPLKFVPPPPPPQKVVPSKSGVVTRSQTARNARQAQTKDKEANTHSFAPKNASFHPPAMKNVPKLPAFGAPKAKKDKKSANILRFEPVASVKEAKQARSTAKQNATETRSRKPIDRSNKVTKQVKPVYSIQSSSSSELESLPKQNLVKMKATRKQIDSKSKTTKPETLKQIHSVHSSSSELDSTTSPKSKNTPNRNRKFANTPKNSIPKSESSSEERLRSPKSSEDVPMTPEQIEREMWKISPTVTLSRGKDNARRETMMKLKEGLLDEDASDMDNVDHFRKQLASEIKRMTEMCDTWDRISEQTVLPDAIQEHILGAVGQARLLMSQKLVQFSSLIERCARPEPGAALITPADLHGFWDMVYMQVENVDVRFKKLEAMRSRGWKEEPVIKPRIVKPVVKPTVKPAVKPTVKPAGQSRIKDMIAAARRAKKEQSAPEPTQTEKKTFEAGFFTISSPVRSPAQGTPSSRKPSLLKAVLSNEAKKSASQQNTPFAMLRASVLGKNIECDGVAPLPITPKPQMVLGTPGRSILKTSDTAKKSTKKSAKKSIKIVLFNESDAEINTSTEDRPELVTDSGVSSMDIEKDLQKENFSKNSKLQRQDAFDDVHPVGVMTRRMRRSLNNKEEGTPKSTPRSRGKVLEDVGNVEIVTPKRSSRRRKTAEIAV